MDLTIALSYKNLDFVLHITAMEFFKGSPGTGPTYSCGGTPSEPDEAYATEGWVELDGDVNSIVNITSFDMDLIMLMTNDNEALFTTLCEEFDERIYDTLVDWKADQDYEDMKEYHEGMDDLACHAFEYDEA